MGGADVRFEALGTTAHLVVTSGSCLPGAERLLRATLADLDRTCSRFRSDSDLSRLNVARTAVVDRMLVNALSVALRAARATDGLVDPALGRSISVIGYDRTFTDVPPEGNQPAAALPSRRSWQDIRIDHDTREVELPPGVDIDLGATAKAWGADLAAQRIADAYRCGVLVNLGGDVAVAGAVPDGGWRIRVAHDHSSRSGGQVVSIRTGGVATSSTTVRRWHRAGEVLHHILDPASGTSARRVWSHVSVAAAACVDANIGATAAVVLGDLAPNWLAARDLPARLVAVGGDVVSVAGWPADVRTPT